MGRHGSAESKPRTAIGAETPAAVPGEKRTFVLSDSHDLPAAPRGVVQLLFSLIQVMYLSFYVDLAGQTALGATAALPGG